VKSSEGSYNIVEALIKIKLDWELPSIGDFAYSFIPDRSFQSSNQDRIVTPGTLDNGETFVIR
jgi:hypothetical protein